jgi:hypothetical protein
MDRNEWAPMEAVQVIREMAARVRRNGPERYHAGERLSYALFKAAGALAIVGTERQVVLEEADRVSSAGCRWQDGAGGGGSRGRSPA